MLDSFRRLFMRKTTKSETIKSEQTTTSRLFYDINKEFTDHPDEDEDEGPPHISSADICGHFGNRDGPTDTDSSGRHR